MFFQRNFTSLSSEVQACGQAGCLSAPSSSARPNVGRHRRGISTHSICTCTSAASWGETLQLRAPARTRPRVHRASGVLSPHVFIHLQEIYRFPYGSPCYNADVNPQFRSHTFPVIHIPRKPVDHDIIDFVEHRFGFYPDLQQRLLLTSAAKRVILNCTRQWGKTTVSAAKAVHRAFTVPKSLIVVASPGLRQSGEWMRRAADLLRRLDIPPCGDGCNRISLLLPNGSRIVGLPEAEAKVRGFSALSMLVIDEAARVSDEMYYKALRPMLSVGGGDIWMMTTPSAGAASSMKPGRMTIPNG